MKPYLWAILAAIVWGCVPLIEKLGLAKGAVWVGIFYRCLGVIIGLMILVVFKFPDIQEAIKRPPSGWFFFVAGGLLASIVGQVFFYQALKSGEVSKVTPIAATYPLISFVLGLLLLKEKLTLAKAGGVLFVILGAFLLK